MLLQPGWLGGILLRYLAIPEDAARAIRAGAGAVVLSNHGGHNCDSVCAPIDALPDVVAAVAGRAKVIVDSGVRRGSDILKARALGAEAVMVGRAPLYGAAASGQAGAARALEILQCELNITMAMTGCASIADASPSLLAGHSRTTSPILQESTI